MMRRLLLTVFLALTACSHPKRENGELSALKAQQAITVASNYAVSHFGAPSCSDMDSNWKYLVRQNGDTLVATIGPKDASTLPIKIVMRASDLRIVNARKA